MEKWDYTTDILVVGSGGGGMMAALTAKDLGNDTLIIEKGDYYGGSTAISGGALWIPDNHLMEREGIFDSPAEALVYLKSITKGKVHENRLKAFVDAAPEMVRYLEEKSHVTFKIVSEYSDYYPHAEGAKPGGGRTIEPEKFSIFHLSKPHRKMLRAPTAQTILFGRVMLDAAEGRRLAGISIRDRLNTIRLFMAFFLNPLRCIYGIDTRRALGNALIGRLMLSLEERSVPLWLKTHAIRLIAEGERIVGLEAVKQDKPIRIRAKKGIVLAAGGFEKNQHMRETYQRPPVSAEWSAGIPDNTGDAIQMGMKAGADIDLMDESWWMPVSTIPGDALPWYTKNTWWEKVARTHGSKLAWINIVDRCMPRSVIVNSKGRRFANEAEPYLDFTHNQLACHREIADSIPSWMIVDHKYHRIYPLGPVMPGFPMKRYLENDTVKKGDSLRELAQACGIDPDGLVDEIEKYNQYAAQGKDPDFQKGDTHIDCYYADPTAKQNPCMGPIEKAPFYAIRIFPGDLGTKGGLKTDTHARVLRKDGSVIEGLYATGNCAASVMGDSYPGAGGTIAPSMTFGWIAAHHASR